MDTPPVSLDPLASLLSDMEVPVSDVLAWAEAIHLVGVSDQDVNGDVVVVTARALEVAAGKLKEQWKEAFHLSHRKAR